MIRSLSAVEGGVPLGLWVSVPAYTGDIKCETAHSLNIEMLDAFNQNIPFLLTFHTLDSIITRARNAMVMNFLASDPKQFTDMLFIDSDIGFPGGALIRLAKYPVEIVGAAYPYRKDPLGFPVTFMHGNRTKPDPATGLLNVAGMPCGCLKIGRKALETIMERFPDHYYNEDRVPQKKAWRFFDFVQKDHKFFGEDFAFCALAREAGFDIWCDTNITMQHIGVKHFVGNMQAQIDLEEAQKHPDPMAVIHAFNALNVKVAA